MSQAGSGLFSGLHLSAYSRIDHTAGPYRSTVSYSDLHENSVTDYTFWLDLWQILGVISSVPPIKAPDEGYIKEVLPRFQACLNYVENILWRTDDGLAIAETNETGHIASYSNHRLGELVRKFAAALKHHGFQPGIESQNVCRYRSSHGKSWRQLHEYCNRHGREGISFIFSEIEAIHVGKTINLIPKVSEVVQDLSSKGLGHVILLPGIDIKSGQEVYREVVSTIPLSKSLSAFVASDGGRPLIFEQLSFNRPLYILYSPGTTGPLELIVHRGWGVLAQTRKELEIHLEVGMDDTHLQFTTTTWMA
ncbi:hypothetical protein BJY52DRAFT_1192561 [Lactarius psammicola]|nr:hypothetical protein BJY52DRAFT_1192561 [Lactarius psammicola]